MNLKKTTGQEIKPIKFSRLRILKNLTIICLTFALLFTAYDGLSMLQSTMNGKQGMGSYSQALVYFVFAGSSLLLPNYLIKKLGCKTNLFVGSVLYLPFIVSNVYPTWATMMSSAVLLGFGASILWASQCTYLNEASGLYCTLLNDCVQDETTPPKRGKFKNSELFVIQDISEKLMSKDQFIQFGCVKESETDPKFDSLKAISENNQDVKTFVINTKPEYKDEMKDAKNFNANDDPYTIFAAIKSEKPTRVIDTVAKFENLNSQSEQCIIEEDSYKYDRHIKKSYEDNMVYTANTNNNSQPSSIEYASCNNDNIHRSFTIESVTARFFGCFGLMYCTAQIWSNLITYYVLNISSEPNRTYTANYSCGASFCNSKYEAFSSVADEIPLNTRYLLIGITLTLSVTASLLLLIFLDPLDTNEETVTFSLSHVMAAFNHLRKKEQIFMVPLSMFTGMSQGFFTADFTKSYVQCAWSISQVGLVAVFFGLTSGLSSSLSGWVVKYLGRIPVVLFGLALHLGIDIFLLFWNPDSENPAIFYLAAGLYGTVVGLFYSQIQTFYGLLFKNDEETAFATHYFCSAMGWSLSFIYSDYLCTSIKIYILMIISCVGVFGYLAADRSFRSRITQ